MARFRPITHDPIRSELASAIEIARLFAVLDALSGTGLRRSVRSVLGDALSHDFTDDPLSAGGFGPADQTIRVRPGPVRTTLIRPSPFRRMTDQDGYCFNDPRKPKSVPYVDSAEWVQAFIQFFALQRRVDLFAPAGEKSFKYVFTRAMAPQRSMKLDEVIDIIASEATAGGQTVSREAIRGAIDSRLGLEPTDEDDDDGPLSISLAYVPTTFHKAVHGDQPDRDPNAIQVTATFKLDIKKDPPKQSPKRKKFYITMDYQVGARDSSRTIIRGIE
jgi:hypothetical protein